MLEGDTMKDLAGLAACRAVSRRVVDERPGRSGLARFRNGGESDLPGLAACRGVSRRFAACRGVSPMKDLAGLDWHDLEMVANQTCQVWRRVAAFRVA